MFFGRMRFYVAHESDGTCRHLTENMRTHNIVYYIIMSITFRVHHRLFELGHAFTRRFANPDESVEAIQIKI